MDILTGTTDCDVDWRMLNMNAELVASSLSLTLRSGLHMLRPYWRSNVNDGDGVAPINHILKFETFGHPCSIQTTLRQESQIRLVTTRNDDESLKRGHLVLTCQLFKTDNLVGRSEFWLALTRPLAPPDERMPSDVPEGLKFLKEHELGEDDLLSRDIESYRCEGSGDMLTYDTQPVVFHMDQSDQYRISIRLNTWTGCSISCHFNITKLEAMSGACGFTKL